MNHTLLSGGHVRCLGVAGGIATVFFGTRFDGKDRPVQEFVLRSHKRNQYLVAPSLRVRGVVGTEGADQGESGRITLALCISMLHVKGLPEKASAQTQTVRLHEA
jgi:hypothetical protein